MSNCRARTVAVPGQDPYFLHAFRVNLDGAAPPDWNSAK